MEFILETEQRFSESGATRKMTPATALHRPNRVHASAQSMFHLALPISLCIFFKVVPDSQLLLRESYILSSNAAHAQAFH